MSKVYLDIENAKLTYPVSAAVVATGWMPGQAFTLNSTATSVAIAVTDEALFVGMDDDTEVSTPPTGSLVTCVYGAGTTLRIDHSQEVAASSAARAYVSGVESAAIAADLYINNEGKWTNSATGSVKGKMFVKPTAANNYTLGVILRF